MAANIVAHAPADSIFLFAGAFYFSARPINGRLFMTTQEQLVGEMIEMVSEMRSCVRIMRSDVADMRHVVTRPARSTCPVCGGAGSCSRGWFECGACDYEGSC